MKTPALVLNTDILDRNLQRMRAQLRRLGVPLRPHVKTSKCIDVVRRSLEGEPGGITVSTLKEAEYFLSQGVRDILYAVGIAPGKLPDVIDLIKRGAQVTLILDNTDSVRAVATAARAAGVTIPLLIELDVDEKRSGVQPDAPQLIEVGRAIAAADGLELRGVMAHAGGSYNSRAVEEIAAMAEQERSRSVAAAERLRAAGLPCPVVSVGSTPTALFACTLEGVTEVRAGVYVFQDLVMAGIGVCSVEELALSVQVSVIGHQPQRGWIITDGGWMALSRDRGTSGQAVDQGYGLVRAADGRAPQDDLIVTNTNQEHGVIARRDGAAFDVTRYPVGTQLRILPNHACATAAQHQRYHLFSAGSLTGGIWQRVNGWD